MYIPSSLIDLIIDRCTIEYSGVHSSNGWPGRAYWRVYVPKQGFVCKIVSKPIRSKNPTAKTLKKLLKESFSERFSKVQVVVDMNHYGQVSKPRIVDPTSIMGVLEVVEGKYYEFMMKGLE